MKTVALYSPYIPKHFGGGERYLLSIAEATSKTHKTFLLVPAAQVKQTQESLLKYTSAFGLDLSKIEVKATSIGNGKNPIQLAQETRLYDVLFAMTDGSIFASFAKHSYFIVQVPWTRKLSVLETVKLRTWSKIFVYSEFVASVLKRSWKTSRIAVLSPYVDTKDFSFPAHTSKEKIILSIGRFFAHEQSNSKRQDVLIDAFKELVDTHHVKTWTLVLVGNVESHEFLETLKKQAKGYRVVFATNISYDEVRAYCVRASFYWHAAGFEVNEIDHPENTEHFGITTLEAMASGAIPFVVPLGGQREVVNDTRFFWTNVEELVEKTYRMITDVKNDETGIQLLREELREKAENYSKVNFERIIRNIVG
ncbi:MAG: glycosyltransferase family 4 protein [Candidatus Woesebacteria bacterium]